MRPSPGIRRFFRRAARDTGGAAAVEFGLIVPMLALMVVGIMDVGLAVHRKMQVEHAAQAGAEYAILNGFDASAISSAVTSATSATGITADPPPENFCGCATSAGVAPLTCGTTCPGGAAAGTYTTVSAKATYSTIINYTVVPDAYTFGAKSTVRLQ
ncbi:TadE/TadG family type IV pilus assembly protein [Bradyrhizobium sp.]|uniref:TadE/TadG family type IV pilus assembly protein n=1 Tax=Bradyrhizobium sp. TaxID=376 RepID=UPI004037CA96